MLRHIIIIASLFLFPLSALANASPQKTLESAQSRLDALLQSAPSKGSKASQTRRAKLEAEAEKLFDFEELSKRVLQSKWEEADPSQQSEFVEIFSELVRDTYLLQLEGQSAKGLALTWEKESLQGNFATVEAKVAGKTPAGKPVEVIVVYHMKKRASNWMVYNVITDGSSLESSYKSTFRKMFKKEGDFAGVLDKLRAKAGKKAPKTTEVTPTPKEEIKSVPTPKPDVPRSASANQNKVEPGKTFDLPWSTWEVFAVIFVPGSFSFGGDFMSFIGFLQQLRSTYTIATL